MSLRTVFILGAGASVAAGGPVMRDFMKCADQVRKNSKWAVESFAEVQKARGKLLGVLAKSNVNIHNIEDLFATFEMARLIRRLGDLDGACVQKLPTALRYVIMRTIEQAIEFEVDKRKVHLESPFPYDAFVELLDRLANISELSPAGVISFNYDLALDYALTLRGVEIDYGLEDGIEEVKSLPYQWSTMSKRELGLSQLQLLKPHGSLNWFFNQTVGSVDAHPVRPFPIESYFRRMGTTDLKRTPVDIMELIFGPDEWGERPRPEPVIVPPTWNKADHHKILGSVWRRSSRALLTAENIFVIGYSLPSSDYFFKSFFALSSLSETLIERFWVFDPGDVADRYRELVGPAITSHGAFRHEKLQFTEAIIRIARQFDLEESDLHSLLLRDL